MNAPVVFTDLTVKDLVGLLAFKSAGRSILTGSLLDLLIFERGVPLKSTVTSLTLIRNVTAALINRDKSNGFGMVVCTPGFKSISNAVHLLAPHGLESTKSCIVMRTHVL